MSDRVRSKKILAFDWDARTLRVVHAQVTKRGVKIDRLLSVGIPSDVDTTEPAQMGVHIRRVLGQEGITTRHAVVDIPRDQAILNTLKLPYQLPDELPGMVEMQIAKELPFPVGEAAIDFAVESRHEDGVTADVLVAAIRREVLQQYEATFAAAGLRLDRMGLRPYANKVAACELLKHGMPDRVLIVDVRPALTEIDVLRDSALVFSRAASVMIPSRLDESPRLSIAVSKDVDEPIGEAEDEDGAETPATTAGVIRSLVVEVTRSIEAYRASDTGATIDHAVIVGDVGIEEALAETIQKRLDVTSELYNPATTFGWSPDEGAGAAAFAAALGLVLGHADTGLLHFDFLHPKKPVTVAQKRLRTAPKVAAVVAFFLVACAVAFSAYTRSDREQLEQIEASIAESEAKAEENERFLAFMEEIREFDRKHVWIDVLHDVITQLPEHDELVVESVKTKKEGRVLVLKTRAKHRDTAATARRSLEAFHREGREKRRFEVTILAQDENKGKGYPHRQDLEIEILDDGSTGEGLDGSARRRRG